MEELVFGHYRADKVLGRGAMGVVYRATDMRSGAIAAIKTISKDLLASSERDEVLRRFRREADVAMSLKHPNIVSVYECDDFEGLAYMAMELVEGQELADLIKETPVLPLERVVTITRQVLDALAFTHRQGIIHRDIKPSNIFVLSGDRVKLMDFGIAKVESVDMTQAGALLGTPSYMSPEQVMGEGVDSRSDLFSTGAMLYQLLSGQKPFTGPLTAILTKILNHDPPPPSSINYRTPASFDPVVRHAMARRKERRIASAESFAEALEAAWAAGQTALPQEDDADRTVIGDATVNQPAADLSVRSAYLELDSQAGRFLSALKECIDEEVSAERLETIADAFTVYGDLVARLAGSATAWGKDPRLAAIVGRDTGAVGGDGLQRVKGLILAQAPVPGRELTGDRLDWLECIDLFVLMRRFLARLGVTERADPVAQDLVREISVFASLYANEINRVLFSPDHLDIQQISADFLRLDLLQWALELLGGTQEVRSLTMNLRMFAAQVMRKVNASIRDFTTRHDEFARFDVANILLEVEELIVMATRIVEKDAAAEGDYTSMLGTDVIVDFVENAGRLVELTTGELEEDLAQRGEDADVFAGKLGQIGRLYQFSVRLDSPEARPQLHGLSERVRAAAQRLVDRALVDLPAVAAAPEGLNGPAGAALVDKLNALYEMAESLNWAQLAQDLLGALRRQTVMADLRAGGAAADGSLNQPLGADLPGSLADVDDALLDRMLARFGEDPAALDAALADDEGAEGELDLPERQYAFVADAEEALAAAAAPHSADSTVMEPAATERTFFDPVSPVVTPAPLAAAEKGPPAAPSPPPAPVVTASPPSPPPAPEPPVAPPAPASKPKGRASIDELVAALPPGAPRKPAPAAPPPRRSWWQRLFGR